MPRRSARPRRPSGRALVAGRLETPDGRRAGQIVLYRGDISWLFATVDDPGVNGDFAVERIGADLRENGTIRVNDAAGNARNVARSSVTRD